MVSRILITGGTGTLGRLLVPRVEASGNDVRVLSRQEHTDLDGVAVVAGDLSTGEGIQAAVDGVDVVVHAAGSAKGDEVKARHLVAAARRAGVGHVVFISVVGADRIPMSSGLDRAMFGYFGSKRAAEVIIEECGLPWTTLRATQFHDLLFDTVRQMARLPLVPVPAGFKFQPVATSEVADALAKLALDAPAGLVPDLAGPRVYGMDELVRSYLQNQGKHRLVVPVPVPGRAAAAFRDGANLAPERAVGRGTWEGFLEAQQSKVSMA